MFWRIRIDLAFEKEASINAIKNTALDHFAKAFTINPGTPEEERGTIVLEKCYHNEHPPKPCQLIEEHLTPE